MSSAIKIAYSGSGTALAAAASLASLASDSSLLAGVQSAEIDNTANLYDDNTIRGHIKTGTTPTVNTNIECWVIPVIDGDAYPDVFTGAGTAAKTVTSRNVLRSVGKLAWSATMDAVAARVYPFCFNLSQVPGIGQSIPRKCVLFFVHNTGAALDSTSGNHVVDVVGVYYNVG